MRIRQFGQLTFASMFFCASLHAAPSGIVIAKVLDHNRKPVSEAVVLLTSATNRILAAVIPTCLTNRDGICTITNVQFDEYHVTAMKRADGYPNLAFNFYGHGKWPSTVVLIPKRSVVKVTIRLGPRAAVLTLHVIDDLTGIAVKDASATLRDSDRPRDFFSTSLGPDSTVLVPYDEDVQLEVTAKGYRPWFLKEHREVNGAVPLRLRSAERVSMTIGMSRH